MLDPPVDLTPGVTDMATVTRGFHRRRRTAADDLLARCPSCDEAVLRFVRTPTSAHLDLHGAASLVVRLPAES